MNVSNEWCLYKSVAEGTFYQLASKIDYMWGMGAFISPLMGMIRKNFGRGVRTLKEIMHDRMGFPFFTTFEEFVSDFRQKESLNDKFKMLKKSIPEINIVAKCEDNFIHDII